MDEEGTSCIDRISELPDFILHHILSYLTTKEAAQLSVISKKWQYVWETYPVFDCYQDYFGEYLRSLNPKVHGIPKDERCKIFNQRLKFMSYIDKRLLQFREENLCVNKFVLDMTLVSMALAPRVDTWMELLADMCIRELNLSISVGKKRFYDLPKIIFTMESLTVLKLRGSIQLSSRLNRNAIKLCSLVELHLTKVSIDEDTIQDLILFCHSMKVFSLICCLGFESVEICDHNKLEKMVYHSYIDFKLKKFSIKVQTLEKLEIWSLYRDMGTCEIIVSLVCQNLKRLSLSGIPIDANWLQSMITSLPLLEHLFLVGCLLRGVIHLSNQSLKEIHICNCMNLFEAEFDTPNVRSFIYRGETMPRLFSNSVADYRTAELIIHRVYMGIFWFMRLNNFLRDANFQDLTFLIVANSGNEMSFNVEDYTGIQFTPFELNNMKLVSTSTLINYAALLDGLFCNLRPRILSLVLNSFAPIFVKEVLKCLGAEEPYCYCSENLECWRHSLKDIKLINNVKGLKKDTILNAMTLDNFTNFVDDWVIEAPKNREWEQLHTMKDTLSFQLSWYAKIAP